MNRPQKNVLGNERGAILIQVAVSMIGLLAFGALAMDYGVLWAARRQAQNAADAAALAGAGMLQTGVTDWDGARRAAQWVAQKHYVFGAHPQVTLGSGFDRDAAEITDISFPLCPPGAPGALVATCVRVKVYRNEDPHDGVLADPLPTFFGRLFGQTRQGVRAVAYAEAAAGNATDCLRPFAVPDLFVNNDSDTTFTAGDVYRPPSDPNPTGYTLANDLGTEVLFKYDPHTDRWAPGWFMLLDFGGKGGGGSEIRDEIPECQGDTYAIGDDLTKKEGGTVGPVKQGIDNLVDLDPSAKWDSTAKKIIPDCVDTQTCKKYVDGAAVPDPNATVNPRIIPLPVFDPQLQAATGEIKIVNILGFFVENDTNGRTIDGKDTWGIIINKPDLFVSGGGNVDQSASFVTTLILVR